MKKVVYLAMKKYLSVVLICLGILIGAPFSAYADDIISDHVSLDPSPAISSQPTDPADPHAASPVTPTAEQPCEPSLEASASTGIESVNELPESTTAEISAATVTPYAEPEENKQEELAYKNMYRMYNPNSGEHFYTSDLDEARHIFAVGWRWEGIGWVAPDGWGAPVYRLYNPNAGDHHYTTSVGERDHLTSVGWRYEGIGWYSSTNGASRQVWRQYNPNARTGTHNFTTSTAERDTICSVGWRNEGVAWQAADHPSLAIQGFWVVTCAYGSLERYWIDSTAQMAVSRLIDSTSSLDAGSEWSAWASDSGAVVRNRMLNYNGWQWTDNEGRMTPCPTGKLGWQNPAWMYQVSAFSVNAPGYTTTSRLAATASRDATIETFIGRAFDYLGTRYVWDFAEAPGVGVDCAGLVLQCMQAVGINSRYNAHDHRYTPGHDHYANDMWGDSQFQHVGVESRQRGDLISYEGHVAIYLGNNQVIEAVPSRVRTANWNWTRPRGVLRVFA